MAWNDKVRGKIYEVNYYFTSPITKENQPLADQIINLVDPILSIKQQDPDADTSNLEKEIDQLVYELYNLTDEEIKIVEGV
jgi:type II restriction/modification system DNA methylase subunit YeeA